MMMMRGCMETPRIPPTERRRLDALAEYNILDTPPESMFDDITAAAAESCQAPMALLSFIDRDRQWCKSAIGFPREIRRELSFCGHAINQPDLSVVPDASKDPRFAGNPLVAGSSGIRFYAGVPLVTATGDALGTLCVLDRVAREVTDEQAASLRALARSAMCLLDLRRKHASSVLARAAEGTVEGITIADGSLPDLPLIFANRAFCEMTGYSCHEVIGRNCRFLQGDGTDQGAVAVLHDGLARRVRTTADILNYTKSGRPFWNRVSLLPFLDTKGDLLYVVGLQYDITAQKEAEVKRLQLQALHATMRTVNDIVLNFMNNLQLYRHRMEQDWQVNLAILQQFDSIFDETLARLSSINQLPAYRQRTIGPNQIVLDTERDR